MKSWKYFEKFNYFVKQFLFQPKKNIRPKAVTVARMVSQIGIPGLKLLKNY